MMNDDEKRTKDNKDAEVIDLEAAREKKEAEKDAKVDASADDAQKGETQSISLNEAISTIKTAFTEVKSSLEPLAATLKEMTAAAQQGAEQAKARVDAEEQGKSFAEMSDTERVKQRIKDAANGVSDAKKTASQVGEIVNLSLERLKRQGVEKKIDLKSVVQNEFESYADKNLKDGDYETDENGKKVVTVNAKFLQEHSEVIPNIIGGVANSFVRTLFGDVLGIQEVIDRANQPDGAQNADDAKKADDAEKADQAVEAEKLVEQNPAADDQKSDPKYRVQFDFAKLFGNIIKSATLTTNGAKPAEGEEETIREVSAKSAILLENTLNGKPTDLNDLQINAQPPKPDSLTPEEIQPLDEKHQRILDLAKEYDQALKGDDDENK